MGHGGAHVAGVKQGGAHMGWHGGGHARGGRHFGGARMPDMITAGHCKAVARMPWHMPKQSPRGPNAGPHGGGPQDAGAHDGGAHSTAAGAGGPPA
mgnify:FL=1